VGRIEGIIQGVKSYSFCPFYFYRPQWHFPKDYETILSFKVEAATAAIASLLIDHLA